LKDESELGAALRTLISAEDLGRTTSLLYGILEHQADDLAERQTNSMATHLDQQIELLEDMVERHLDLCDAAWNGTRCTLPRNHEQTVPHKFSIEFLNMPACSKTPMPLQTGRATRNRKEHESVDPRLGSFPLE
jgi:hypothetical protein